MACYNAEKTKFVVVLPNCRRSLAEEFQSCIEHVKSFLHLSHLFTSEFNDDDDITNGRSNFVRHTYLLFLKITTVCSILNVSDLLN